MSRTNLMDVQDTIYAVLDADNKISIDRLQKIIYFATKKITDLDIPPYKTHYYGPFSPGLYCTIEKMVSFYFLCVTGYGGYKYTLTSDGQEISEIAKEREKDKFEEIADVVNTCKDFELSYASKIHYLLEDMSFSDAVDYARQLRWKPSKDSVEQGVKLLEKLELTR